MPQINQMNPSQRQAVERGEGPLLVLAGPGSGKTTVIVQRILYLINHRKVSPENILVMTFTKDAARSMQNRFIEEAGEHLSVNFGTFHSVFYHILRQSHRGHSRLTLITRSQKKNILIQILKEIMISGRKHYDMDTLREDADNFLDAIGFYKNTKEEKDACKRLSEPWKNEFGRVFEAFRKKMNSQGGLDFDDMVYECLELLQRDKSQLQYWQERFCYILIDEFQDINPMQYETVKLLGRKHQNLFVVGDDDQSIYGFRGSKPACIRQFQEEFQAPQVILNANYRSSREIVEAAAKMISENKNRYQKALYAAGEYKELSDSVKIRIFKDMEEETGWVKEKIKCWCDTLNRETCGVLFRTNTGMQRIASVLNKEGIPFTMRGQCQSPYEHFIAKDILGYLKFAKGDNSRENFLRIMNRPIRYLDRETVGEMNPIDLPLLRMRYARRGQPNDSKIMQEIDSLSRQLSALKHMSPGPAVLYLCKAVGYEAYLRKKASSQEQLEDWLERLAFLKEEAMMCGDLEEWEIVQKQWEKRETKRDFSDKRESAESGICLMTVHASKGLEFDHVILPDCNEKNFPHGNMPDEETVEEERRIFYVGMTRAKKSLELLCVTGSKERPRLLSRFLNPILKDYRS